MAFETFKTSQKEPFHEVVDDLTGKAEAFIYVIVIRMQIYLPNGGDGQQGLFLTQVLTLYT